MKRTMIFIFLLAISNSLFAEKIEIDKKDYLKLIVSSYVNGFNEFDTSVSTFSDSVSIGIYYNISTQEENRANQLARRFRTQIPLMFKSYEWAQDVKLVVTVYSEDRTGRGY